VQSERVLLSEIASTTKIQKPRKKQTGYYNIHPSTKLIEKKRTSTRSSFFDVLPPPTSEVNVSMRKNFPRRNANSSHWRRFV
jgi:hypothetical protein